MASSEPSVSGRLEFVQNQRHKIQKVNDIKLTQEENDLLNELRREAVWKRGIPCSLGAMCGAVTLLKTGKLKIRQPWGPVPILVGVVIAGDLGVMSYVPTMQKQILERLPHSNLAIQIRKSKNLPPLEEPSPPSPQWEPPETNENYDSNASPNSIDHRFEPSLDREVNIEEPKKKKSITYEDLRKKNREEYERSKRPRVSDPSRSNPGTNDGPPTVEEPEAHPEHAPPSRKKRTNIWGDEIDD